MEQRELETRYLRDIQVSASRDIYREMADIKSWEKEVFVVFCLDTRHRIISREIVSIGILNASVIHTREVFRTAIARNACAVVVAHNHPSGSREPSEEDKKITRQLKQAGELLGISLLDHVIVTNDRFYSFSEHGLV